MFEFKLSIEFIPSWAQKNLEQQFQNYLQNIFPNTKIITMCDLFTLNASIEREISFPCEINFSKEIKVNVINEQDFLFEILDYFFKKTIQLENAMTWAYLNDWIFTRPISSYAYINENKKVLQGYNHKFIQYYDYENEIVNYNYNIEKKNKIFQEIENILNQKYTLNSHEKLGETNIKKIEDLSRTICNVKAIHVEFDINYLKIPGEIIKTTILNNINGFILYKNGQITNTVLCFIDYTKERDLNIIKKAYISLINGRLFDAQLLLEQDNKKSLNDLQESLNKICFFGSNISYLQKQRTIQKIMEKIFTIPENIAKFVSMYNIGLSTHVAMEFPNLRMFMTHYILRKEGLESICEYIYDAFLQKDFKTTNNNVQLYGINLKISDYLYDIFVTIAHGAEITGKKDPFYIKQKVNNLIQIMVQMNLKIDLAGLINIFLNDYNVKVEEYQRAIQYVQNRYLNFISDSLKVNTSEFIMNNDHILSYELMNEGRYYDQIINNDNWQKLKKRIRGLAKISTNQSVEKINETQEDINFFNLKNECIKINSYESALNFIDENIEFIINYIDNCKISTHIERINVLKCIVENKWL